MFFEKIIYLPIVCLLWKVTVIESEFINLPQHGLPPNYNNLPNGTCEETRWSTNPMCSNGLTEIFQRVRPSDGNSWRKCCTPNSKAEHDARLQFAGTKCAKPACSTNPNPCSTLDQYYVNGQSFPFVPFVQDTCMGNGFNGNVAICCLTNSTNALKASLGAAENHELPYMAHLSGGCGGSIYDKRHIITAAHCVVNNENHQVAAPESVIVTVGTNIYDYELTTPEFQDRRYNVEEIMVHEDFSWLPQNVNRWPALISDIAILRLNRDIQFGTNIKSIKMAPSGFDSLRYTENGVISGWGNYDESMENSWQLQKTNVIIRNDDICRTIWPKTVTNFESQVMCVGGIYGGKYSPVSGQGDSGGPAVCRDDTGHPVLCGLTSMVAAGPQCARTRTEEHCYASIYTEIQFYHEWIRNKTNAEQDPSTFHSPYLYGEPVRSGRYEHQVHITSTNGKPCGGTLIAPDTVVTAAQCVTNTDGSTMNKADVTVVSGIRDLMSTGNAHEVQNIYVLDGFERVGNPVDVASQGDRVYTTDNYYKNDLAVIKLLDDVNIGWDKLATMPSLRNFSQEFANEVSFPRNSTMSGQLMQREFRVLTREDCQKRWGTVDYLGYKVTIDDNVLCGVETYSGGSQCDRELGGGLICRGSDGSDELCGVQVFRLCEFTLPNGFVNVATHKDWVESL